MTWLWLLPDALLPLVVAGLGLLVMIGALSFGRAMAVAMSLTLLPVLIDAALGVVFDVLPLWLLALAMIVIASVTLRRASEFVLGEHATGHVIGHFTSQAIVAAARFLPLPLHLAGWLLTQVLRWVGR